jgi:arylsulfatase A-like enzyme
VGANWDFWATFSALAGAPAPQHTDGISLLPTLTGRQGQREHASLYWEFHANGASQAVRMGRWKGIRNEVVRRPDAPIELYDLAVDPSETKDVAAAHPDIVKRIAELMQSSRTPAVLPQWSLRRAAARLAQGRPLPRR